MLLPADLLQRTRHASVPALALIRAGVSIRFVVLGLVVAALWLWCSPWPHWDDELASMSPLPVAEKSLDGVAPRDRRADVRYLMVVQARPGGSAGSKRAGCRPP